MQHHFSNVDGACANSHPYSRNRTTATTINLASRCRHIDAKCRVAQVIRSFQRHHNRLPGVNELVKLAKVRRETASAILRGFDRIKLLTSCSFSKSINKDLINRDINIPKPFTKAHSNLIDIADRIHGQVCSRRIQLTLELPVDSIFAISVIDKHFLADLGREVQILLNSQHVIVRVEKKHRQPAHFHIHADDPHDLFAASKTVRAILNRQDDGEQLASLFRRMFASRLPLELFQDDYGNVVVPYWENLPVKVQNWVERDAWPHTYLAKRTQAVWRRLPDGTSITPRAWFWISPQLEALAKADPLKISLRFQSEQSAQAFLRDCHDSIAVAWREVPNRYCASARAFEFNGIGVRHSIAAQDDLLDGFEKILDLYDDSMHQDGQWHATLELHPASWRMRVAVRYFPKRRRQEQNPTPAVVPVPDVQAKLFEMPAPRPLATQPDAQEKPKKDTSKEYPCSRSQQQPAPVRRRCTERTRRYASRTLPWRERSQQSIAITSCSCHPP